VWDQPPCRHIWLAGCSTVVQYTVTYALKTQRPRDLSRSWPDRRFIGTLETFSQFIHPRPQALETWAPLFIVPLQEQ
jgi:hypothetical protein